MQYFCEHCNSLMPGPGVYHEFHDEYWCESCIDNEAEAADQRQQERFYGGDAPVTLSEQQAAARRLK